MIEEIVEEWKNARSPVVFTGAGMSTASGLPDFRSQTGLWKSRPEALATLEALQNDPDEFYFFYQWRIKSLWDVSPNEGHDALAQLQEERHINTLITQNVDGLHQRAGSKNVFELHGTLLTVSNQSRTKHHDSRQLLPKDPGFEKAYREGNYKHGDETVCPVTGEKLRPNVVLFGEALPEEALMKSFAASKQSDFFVVIGSSLMVSPANHCPILAVQNGAKLVIINQQETPLDDHAWKVLREPAVEVLTEIAGSI